MSYVDTVMAGMFIGCFSAAAFVFLKELFKYYREML